MHLNQATINTLKDLFDSMDTSELDEALEMLLEEAFKRDWDNQPLVESLETPVIIERF